MWTLKSDVKIVLRRHGLIVTQKTLKANQHLAEIILNDPVYNAQYGHNLEGEGKTKAQEETKTIEVTVKKKAEVTSPQPPPTSSPYVSTSTEVKTGGMNLNVSEQRPESKSKDSGQPKQGTAKEPSKGKK